MPYSIKTKDGITVDNIPDDIAPDAPELKARVEKARASRDTGPAKAPPPIIGGVDPTEGMGTLEKAFTGFAGGVHDRILGAKQLAAEFGLGDKDKLAQEAAEKKRLDAPLNTGAGAVGNFMGNIVPDMLLGGGAASAATRFLPQGMRLGRALTAAGVQGAEAGALTPGEKYDPAAQAATGAALGVGGDVAMRGVGRALRPMQDMLPARVQEQIGELAGMPRMIAENVTDSKAVRALTNALGQLGPFGASVNNARRANLGQYTSEVTGAAGAPTREFTPEAARGMRERLDSQAAAFREGPDVPLTDVSDNLRPMLDDIMQTAGLAGKPPPRVLQRAIDAARPDAAGTTIVPANTAFRARSEASTASRTSGSPSERRAAYSLAQELERAMAATHPDQGQAFTRWKAEHGVSKDIEAAKVDPSGHLLPESFVKQLSPEAQMAPRTPLERRTVAAAERMASPNLSENRSMNVQLLLGGLGIPLTGAVLGGAGGSSSDNIPGGALLGAGGSLALANMLLGTRGGARYLTGQTDSAFARALQSRLLKELLQRGGAAAAGEQGG